MVSGWTMFDPDHPDDAEPDANGRPGSRGTIWEIHRWCLRSLTMSARAGLTPQSVSSPAPSRIRGYPNRATRLQTVEGIRRHLSTASELTAAMLDLDGAPKIVNARD